MLDPRNILATSAQNRALDRDAIENYGMPGVALMENAGRAATEALHCHLLAKGVRPQGARIAIFCGSGNNGGDGYVIARHLAAKGYLPEVFLLAHPDRVTGDARVNLDIVGAMGLPIHLLAKEQLGPQGFNEALEGITRRPWAACVDALLGTGLSSPVSDRYLQLVEWLNARSLPTLAVDIPSGLNADTGAIMGAAVQATLTVTFGVGMPGLLVGPGRDCSGQIEVADIGFPIGCIQALEGTGLALDEQQIRALFPTRPRHVHKGSFGHVLVVAGSPGKVGAAVLAGSAALRSGAGLVTVATHALCRETIAAAQWELMSASVFGEPDRPDWSGLDELLAAATVVAFGPGLGNTPTTREGLSRVLEKFSGPVVIDADGLNVLAQDPTLLKTAKGPLVLTPHPGEMSRLAAKPARELLGDALGATRDLAKAFGAVVALKTATTTIAEAGGRYAVNTSGTPGMASAGMGDVLTGIVAGFMAQGLFPFEATCAAVLAHGLAGERSAALHGQRATTAAAVLGQLGTVLKAWEESEL